MIGDVEEFEEGTASSYAKFKTHNEIDPDLIEKYAPKPPVLDGLDEIVPFGMVVQFVSQGSGMLLIQPSNISQIYDLDNIVALGDKQVIGFIYDVIGQINDPLYSVMLFPQIAEKFKQMTTQMQAKELKDFFKGKDTFIVKKCMKVITSEIPKLLAKKGCDASNVYDEELQAHE